MGQKAKPQWELYTDEELVGGAQRWSLTVVQERQRLRIIQSDFREWPIELRAFLETRHSSGVELVAFTQIQHSVVTWLKEGNSVSLVAGESMKLELVAA